MDIVLANPRGFCAGVDRAIIIVEQALEKFGAPIYVRHEVVHNKFVVDELKNKGAIFIEELDEVPAGNTVIFSAHGVSKDVRAEAERRGLRVFDATCPLVTKVHIEVEKMHKAGREIIMIGHKGHPEVEGTMGQSDSGMYLVETPADVEALTVKDPAKLSYVTQTTLSRGGGAPHRGPPGRKMPRGGGAPRATTRNATHNTHAKTRCGTRNLLNCPRCRTPRCLPPRPPASPTP